MDFTGQFNDLQKRVAEAQTAAQAAATESRGRLKQRIDQAQDDLDQAAADTEQKAREATAGTQSKWALPMSPTMSSSKVMATRGATEWQGSVLWHARHVRQPVWDPRPSCATPFGEACGRRRGSGGGI